MIQRPKYVRIWTINRTPIVRRIGQASSPDIEVDSCPVQSSDACDIGYLASGSSYYPPPSELMTWSIHRALWTAVGARAALLFVSERLTPEVEHASTGDR